ncbi:hypothetical protein Tco_1148584, partial [Tanacetum coccineum]
MIGPGKEGSGSTHGATQLVDQ